MAVPGVLMRLAQPTNVGTVTETSLVPASPCPNIEAIHTLTANDEGSPSRNAIYYLSDITPILESSAAYDEDVKQNKDELSSLAWVICKFINGRESDNSANLKTSPQTLASPPPEGSVLVTVGQTPKANKEIDYHAWYDEEHGFKLTLVPGWLASRRYSLAKSYGDAETANFYGFNYYAEKNELGGPAWKAGITEWTLRIRENAAKPNIRRVWKLLATKSE